MQLVNSQYQFAIGKTKVWSSAKDEQAATG